MNISAPYRKPQSIRMRAKDHSIIYARTLVFNDEASPEIVYFPRGHTFGSQGSSWRSRFALAGIEETGSGMILEGLNEKGLAAGLFCPPDQLLPDDIPPAGDAIQHPDYPPGSAPPSDLTIWALSRFSTVKEVKKALEKAWLCKADRSNHENSSYYTIRDRAGNHLVIARCNSQLYLHSIPAKSFTDTPAFDWHPAPASFIRAASGSLDSIPLNTADEAVLQAFCILHSAISCNLFASGSTEAGASGSSHSRPVYRTCVDDLENGRFFFYTADRRQINVLDPLRMACHGVKMLRFLI